MCSLKGIIGHSIGGLPVQPCSPQASSSPVNHGPSVKGSKSGNLTTTQGIASKQPHFCWYLSALLSVDKPNNQTIWTWTTSFTLKGTGSKFCTRSRPSVLGPGPTAGPKAGNDLGHRIVLKKRCVKSCHSWDPSQLTFKGGCNSQVPSAHFSKQSAALVIQ